jgi:hypothetical protein
MRIAADGSIGLNNNTPLSTLDNNGSFGLSIVRTSASITLDATHHTVMLHSGTPSVTLPSASSNARRIYVLVNQTGTARSITTYKDFALNNVSTINANSSITLQSDGTNWYQIR